MQRRPGRCSRMYSTALRFLLICTIPTVTKAIDLYTCDSTALVRVADKASNYYRIDSTAGTLFLRPGAYARGVVEFTVRVSAHFR